MQLNRRTFVQFLSGALGTLGLGWRGLSMHAEGVPAAIQAKNAPDLMLWFKQPSAGWADALPVGNGRLGAMVFGGVHEDHISLNEDTLWSGFPRDWNNPGAKDALSVVRQMVLEKADYHAADQECRKMQGPFNQAYEPLGEVLLQLEHDGEAEDYTRSLDLDSAIAKVDYRVKAVRFTRETFASAAEPFIVIRLTATKAGALTGKVRLASKLQSTSKAMGTKALQLTGKAPSESIPNYLRVDNPVRYSEAEGEGMHFACILQAYAGHGEIVSEGDAIAFRNASDIVLVITAATGYQGFASKPALPLPAVLEKASHALPAAKPDYDAMLSKHLRAHRQLFRRARLQLGMPAASAMPTDLRVTRFGGDPDPSLLALYFNYGRYLLISSSRPGTQPANLQGIWNAELRPPWSSNWTANINVQMNYWLAETCNLSECHLPLFDMVRDLSVNGQKTAQVNYGLPGWVSHHNVDLWRQSAPVGTGLQFADPTWANFCMSGPWLCAHLWEHYRFTKDENFLRDTAFPVMKGSAEFCLAWLVEDGKGGLTTCPSVSTENSFLAPDGKSAQVSAGCTMDIALLHELFSNVRKASAILKQDEEFAGRLEVARQRLRPYRIGARGQLQEWDIDFGENQPGQRHMSHLYPLYPGGEITPGKTPDLAAAARRSLELRLENGGAYTGWSRAWAIALWARLEDGDKAGESLSMLIKTSTGINLFDKHPFGESMTEAMRKSAGKKGPVETAPLQGIFQIDGNFGATAAMAEMLMQSHEEEIAILPALPSAWPAGSVHGLRARGGAEVGIVWTSPATGRVRIQSASGGSFQLRPPAGSRFRPAHRAQPDAKSANAIVLRLKPGLLQELSFAPVPA